MSAPLKHIRAIRAIADAVGIEPAEVPTFLARLWAGWEKHPAYEWPRREVFCHLRAAGIEPHPAYALQGMSDREMYESDEEGGPRLSCRICFFSHPEHLAMTARLPHSRALFRRVITFEKRTGLSWHPRQPVRELLEKEESGD